MPADSIYTTGFVGQGPPHYLVDRVIILGEQKVESVIGESVLSTVVGRVGLIPGEIAGTLFVGSTSHLDESYSGVGLYGGTGGGAGQVTGRANGVRQRMQDSDP